MTDLFAPLTFHHGAPMKNRLMLAPLTNLQSHPNGQLSDEEFTWLVKRAEGGFGLTMTCAAHVQAQGQGFPGQLGIFSDDLLPGLTRLANAITGHGSLGVVQLHHAGLRSPKDLIGTTPVSPSGDEATGARALSTEEVDQLVEDFIAAAVRAEKAGFEGVEIHGAHGYILCQFLSPETNRRTDRYGGSAEKREQIIWDIIAGIRARTNPNFNVGIRLSPERFGLVLPEVRETAAKILKDKRFDYLDLSLWDAYKQPQDEPYRQGKRLADWFLDLPRDGVRLGAAGKIMTRPQAEQWLADGLDFVLLGRGGILHHNWPVLAKADPAFKPIDLPVTRAYLQSEGLSPGFAQYMNTWKGFVSDAEAA